MLDNRERGRESVSNCRIKIGRLAGRMNEGDRWVDLIPNTRAGPVASVEERNLRRSVER